MARIPEADIERLKREIAVERLVEASGITLRKSGKDQIGQCPFHDDAEPSLVVTPTKNLRKGVFLRKWVFLYSTSRRNSHPARRAQVVRWAQQSVT